MRSPILREKTLSTQALSVIVDATAPDAIAGIFGAQILSRTLFHLPAKRRFHPSKTLIAPVHHGKTTIRTIAHQQVRR
jgi:hypothetical protein